MRRVLLVDDSWLVAKAWELTLGNEVEFYHFASPRLFKEQLCKNLSLNSDDIVIVDYYFSDSECSENGTDLCLYLKNTFHGKIFLSSNLKPVAFLEKETDIKFIPKVPVNLSRLIELWFCK